MTIAQDSSHPTGVSDDSPRGSTAATRARERKAYAALQLKKDGETWDSIAEVLGYPTARHALIAVEKMLEQGALAPESQEFMRQLAGARLEEWLYVLNKDATDYESPDRFTAIKQGRELVETHMRLFGYAKPTEVAIYNPLEAEVLEFVQAIQNAKSDGKQLVEIDIFETAPDDEGVYHVTDPEVTKEPEPAPEPVRDDDF